MSAYTTTFMSGRVQSGEYDCIARPVLMPSTARRPIIFAHGYVAGGGVAGANAGSAVSQGSYGKIFDALAQLNAIVVSAEFGGNAFGNATAAARVESARQLAVSYGAKNDKAVVVGFSMGFLTGYGYVRENPGKLAALYGIAPAASVADIYNNQRVDNAAIGSAYGIATTGAAASSYAKYDPTQTPGTLSGVAGRLFYGTADASIVSSTVTNLATALGWTATVIDSSNSHMSDAQLAGLSLSTLTSLVAANL